MRKHGTTSSSRRRRPPLGGTYLTEWGEVVDLRGARRGHGIGSVDAIGLTDTEIEAIVLAHPGASIEQLLAIGNERLAAKKAAVWQARCAQSQTFWRRTVAPALVVGRARRSILRTRAWSPRLRARAARRRGARRRAVRRASRAGPDGDPSSGDPEPADPSSREGRRHTNAGSSS